MAYAAAGLWPKDFIRKNDAPVVWTYTSADPHTDVDGTGWFANGTTLGMKVGDTVIVHDTNAETTTIHRVITAAPLGAATISDQTVPGLASIEVVTAADVITAGESGKTFVFNAAAGKALTLPAVSAGLHFRFVMGVTVLTSVGHTVITPAAATIIYGSTSAAAGTATDTASADHTIEFVENVALPGDMIDLISDGTNWYVQGQVAAAAAVVYSAA